MASWIVPGFGTTGGGGIWVSPLLLEESSFFTFEVTADASDDLFSLAIAQNCIATTYCEKFANHEHVQFAIEWLPDHTLIHPSIVQSHSSSFERGAITLFLVSGR